MAKLNKALLAISIIQLLLTLAIFGINGWLHKTIGISYVVLWNYGTSSLYLLTSILALTAAASGHSCPHFSAIVFSTLSALFSLLSTVLVSLAVTGTGGLLLLFSVPIDRTISDVPIHLVINLWIVLAAISGVTFICLILLSCFSCFGVLHTKNQVSSSDSKPKAQPSQTVSSNLQPQQPTPAQSLPWPQSRVAPKSYQPSKSKQYPSQGRAANLPADYVYAP